MKLTPNQNAIIQPPFNRKTFLEGPAGTGKTTAGVARMLFRLMSDVSANRLLLLWPVSDRTTASPGEG